MLQRFFTQVKRQIHGPRTSDHSSGRLRSRSVHFESLEVRRLLVAEGDVFQLSRSVDAVGLLGDVSAQIRWGDGTESSATVSAQPARGGLSVRFDYSLDQKGFFSGANQSRRALLQDAADAVLRNFSDDLQAIVPAGKKQWNAQFINPATGTSTLNSNGTVNVAVAKNLRVNANELVVFVATRDLAGKQRGQAGPGGFAFSAVTPGSQAELDEILAFRETVQFRGEAGAKGNRPTDFGPWGGSIAFDNQGTDWYFGRDPSGIQADQTDFVSVAMHEFAHVLGFGRSGINKSWDTFTSGNLFTGPKAKAAYVLGGNVPLEGSYHWGASLLAQQNQPTLMRGELLRGTRQGLTDLDTAALDDIGWTRVNTRITVTAEHVYADDGRYPAEIVLQGSKLGETVISAASVIVTNVAPVLTVPDTQTVVSGRPLRLSKIGSISDKGFKQPSSDPATDETFSYTIDWGDGSSIDSGAARIDRVGNASRTTLASFAGTHTFTAPGNYTVRVKVSDDDGGTDTKTFRVTVVAAPKFELSLSKNTIAENDGKNAAVLTVRRSGGSLDTAMTVNLSSNDRSEATLPASVVIAAGDTTATVFIDAVDDNLLDGPQTVRFTANATSVDSDSVDLIVTDHETLTAIFSPQEIREDSPIGAKLTLSRSNTDTQKSLLVRVSGGDPSELDFAADLVIPASQQRLVVNLIAKDDDDAEPTQTFVYTFAASGYVSDQAEMKLIDDEPSFFQNQTNPLDVNGIDGVTALDALLIINQLAERGADTDLDPKTEPIVNNLHYDTNGDYQLTALDALLIINALKSPSSGVKLDSAARLAERRIASSSITMIAGVVEHADKELQRLLSEQAYAETRLF